MILVFLLYLSFLLLIIALFYLVGIRSKRLFVGLPAGFLALPFLLVLGLYLFRAPIEQGRFLEGREGTTLGIVKISDE